MATDAELLARVLADPEDLDSRAVYADQLIAKEDPRGRFITEQLALGRLDSLDVRYAPLLASTHRLLAEHGSTWLGDHAEIARNLHRSTNYNVSVDRLMNAVFENGFIRRIGMREQDLVTQWEYFEPREPLDGIELVLGVWIMEDLILAPPAASRVRSFKLTNDEPFRGYLLPAIMGWGMPLRDLDLSGIDLTPAEATQVWPHLERVRSLSLRGCQIGDEGLSGLFAERGADLYELDLGENELGEPTLAALRRAARTAHLRRLGLGRNSGLGGALGTLAGWSVLRDLEALALPPTTAPAEARALFAEPSANLRELEIAGARDLSRAPDAIAEIARSLTRLDVRDTRIGDAGFARLLQSMRTLLYLSASGCELTDAAAAALVESPLDRLVELDLSWNALTERGIALLARWPGLAHVTMLRVVKNPALTSASLLPLIEHPSFTPTSIEVGGYASDATVQRLRARFGGAIRAFRGMGTTETAWIMG